MNAYKIQQRKAIPKYQRDKLKDYVNTEWLKKRDEAVKKANDRAVFMMLLSISAVLDDKGTSEEARKAFIDAVIEKGNEISSYLLSNKCEYADGHKDYDTDYNRETLKRLAEQYSIEYNEDIFNED
jgi:hypothetical protein